MTSEVEERPRLVTGGYRRHRSQWVKSTKCKHLCCSNAALYTMCFARSYPASHFQHLTIGCHVICLCVLSLLITRHPLNAPGNTCSRFDHTLKFKEWYCLCYCLGEKQDLNKLHVSRSAYFALIHCGMTFYQKLQVVKWLGRLGKQATRTKKIFLWGMYHNITIIENLEQYIFLI